MSQPEFSFANAVMHFRRVPGPRGFVMRFAVIYAIVSVALSAVSIWLQWPLYEIYLRMFTEGGGDIAAYTDEINAASVSSNLASLALLPVSLAIWVMFEAASQRRYIRGEGFALRLGADEGRIAVIGLIWFALIIAAYIAFLIPVAIVAGLSFALGGTVIGAVILVLSILAGFIVFLWLFARLSPASALTIRDRQIRFFEAWGVTKGRGWTLFWAYLTIFLVAVVVTLVAYAILGVVALAQFAPLFQDGAEPDAAAIIGILTQPSFLGPAALVFLLLSLVNAVFVHAFGGPAALAAKHDPRWAGPDSVPEVFT